MNEQIRKRRKKLAGGLYAGERRRRMWSEEEIARLAYMACHGASTEEMCAIFKVERSILYRVISDCRKNGVDIPARSVIPKVKAPRSYARIAEMLNDMDMA